ncbi:MAG: NAD(P)/FAD-dependent oxidoreductase [Candidatus Omnitrophota bacterium]|nr:NAD(P)/FAD-dependent oxidoreductase [Candidatus Omnitrophota bacterium]MBU1928582.1 NAD(P)/FAD-dependent oxidoreductase [Candidatus Omnitrophota bacterium]MBU2034595.1 NAD(P)/FAD-dependent oxidoreductase [Candidatus Omnitrophota bacterium]MBU2257703.1 NAD(P)/FAD-dependent oxidoreductase [Candidatus Omnitrophota bacterium]
MRKITVVVVGAGPAGMMAAIRAAQISSDVILIEKKPSLGNKLLLSGKGRCNLTNACELDLFLERFNNGQFLRDAFNKFFNRDLMDFFENRGLRLKVERQERVFPVTDNSSSILEVLKAELQKNKVRVITRNPVKEILVKDKLVKAVILSDQVSISADSVILTTGGVSYGFTGSSGEGLAMAKLFGHRIVDLKPGLVGLEVKQEYPKDLEGLTLKNIRLKFRSGKKEIVSEVGELLFTGFGISGPLVLSLSGKVADLLSAADEVYAEIDLKPGLTPEKLESRLIREFKIYPRKNLKNTLKELLPLKLIALFIKLTGINAEKKANQVTQSERQRMAHLFKNLRLDIKSTRPIEEAMVTRGGVSLKDINPKTMESRLIRGLYFAGEIIDIDADTGGFNLQAAFSTGYLAGENAASS